MNPSMEVLDVLILLFDVLYLSLYLYLYFYCTMSLPLCMTSKRMLDTVQIGGLYFYCIDFIYY